MADSVSLYTAFYFLCHWVDAVYQAQTQISRFHNTADGGMRESQSQGKWREKQEHLCYAYLVHCSQRKRFYLKKQQYYS